MMRYVPVALVVLFVGACGPEARDPAERRLVSREAAEDLLVEVTDAARSRDVGAVCRLGREPSLCEQHLSDGLDGPVPADPPTIECHSTTTDGTWVVVRGSTDAGETYTSRLLLVESDDGVVAQMPVFWDGMVTSPMSGDGRATVTAPTDPSAITCPS